VAACIAVGSLVGLAPNASAVAPGACGSTLLAGSSWLGGNGVDVKSNGGDEGTGVSCATGSNTVGGVTSGLKWQCVELVDRLYLTRGWISSTWHGNGGRSSAAARDSMYDEAPATLSKQPNGSISSVGPGDVVSINEYFDGGFQADGHVLVVNTSGVVTSGTIPLVSQNSGDPASATPQRTATLSGGTLTINGAGGGWTYSVIGVVHAPGGSTSTFASGSYVSYAGRVYRMAGGAPEYVASGDAAQLPGWGTTTVAPLSAAQFDSLPTYPANGTLISNVDTGQVYVVAGGAPEYIEPADANKVPGYPGAGVTALSNWEFSNYQHLRPYPANGSLISNVSTGQVYVVAGGAPEYIEPADSTKVPGYPNAVTAISEWEFTNYVHLRPYPADGSLITNVSTGQVYVVAGGAPEYVEFADSTKVPGYPSAGVTALSEWEFTNYVHLRRYPADGTLITNVDTGEVYVVAGGAPEYVTYANSTLIPGYPNAGVTGLSEWEFNNYAHLRAQPADGTTLIGAPGARVYDVTSGVAHYRGTTTTPAAVTVDQTALDNAGLASPWNHLISNRPTVSLKPRARIRTKAATFTFSWSAPIQSSAISNFDVRYRRAKVGHHAGTWRARPSWQAVTARHERLAMTKGYTYWVAVRARDKAGSVSGWTAAQRLTRT
jgi:hypothetical protein